MLRQLVVNNWQFCFYLFLFAIMYAALRKQHNAGRQAIDEAVSRSPFGCSIYLLRTVFIILSTLLLLWILLQTGVGNFLIAALAAMIHKLTGDVSQPIDTPIKIVAVVIGMILLACTFTPGPGEE